MSAPASPAVGSGFVSGGDLSDQQGATKLGDGSSHCGACRWPPSVTANRTSAFRLSDGELDLSRSRTVPNAHVDRPGQGVGNAARTVRRQPPGPREDDSDQWT
jgi:hypothetical protein